MRKIQIALCDDEEFFLDEMDKFVSVYGNESKTELEIERYSNPQKLLDTIQKKRYDMLFLDVEMPEMTGMELAKRIRRTDTNVVICFVTSHQGYAIDAFQVDALGYVVKPIQYLDVKHLMERAKIQIHYHWDKDEADKKYLQIHTARDDQMLDMSKIIYIEKRRNQCVFHMVDGECVCYDTLAHIYPKLDAGRFYYTHQGYIANFDQIKEVKKNAVCFSATSEIPVSRKYYQQLHDMHMDKIYRLRREREQFS